MIQRVLVLGVLLAPVQVASAQATTRVSVRSDGLQADGQSATASLSGDGRFVVFASTADDLAPGGNGFQQVYVHDTVTGVTERASVTDDGAPAEGHVLGPVLSHDGRFVVFRSDATNLAPGIANGVSDIFLRDRLLGTTRRVSVAAGGGDPDAWSYYATISADGRFVCFQSEAQNLVLGDSNGTHDVFVHDTWTGTTELVSVNSSGQQGALFLPSVEPSISADGRFVAFASAAALAQGGANGTMHIYVRDRLAGTTQLVSRAQGGSPGNGPSSLPALSDDGRFVAFASNATNLIPGDTNGLQDVFVRDRLRGVTERVNVATGGAQANGHSYLYYSHPTISGDGRFVVFTSYASNLVASDSNGYRDVFVRDRLLGTTELVSVTSAGQQVHRGGTRGAISRDGMRVVFESGDDHLVVGDTNGTWDVFLRIRDSECAPLAVTCSAKTNSAGCSPVIGASGLPLLSGPDAFFVTATSVLSHRPGVLVLAKGPAETPFGGGFLCVAPPLVRAGVQVSAGASAAVDCTGTYSFHLSQADFAALGHGPGTSLWTQIVSRDTGFVPPDDVGLTAALAFTTCP